MMYFANARYDENDMYDDIVITVENKIIAKFNTGNVEIDYKDMVVFCTQLAEKNGIWTICSSSIDNLCMDNEGYKWIVDDNGIEWVVKEGKQ